MAKAIGVVLCAAWGRHARSCCSLCMIKHYELQLDLSHVCACCWRTLEKQRHEAGWAASHNAW